MPSILLQLGITLLKYKAHPRVPAKHCNLLQLIVLKKKKMSWPVDRRHLELSIMKCYLPSKK